MHNNDMTISGGMIYATTWLPIVEDYSMEAIDKVGHFVDNYVVSVEGTAACSTRIFENLGFPLKVTFEKRTDTFSELSSFEQCAPHVSAIIINRDMGVQNLKKPHKTPW